LPSLYFTFAIISSYPFSDLRFSVFLYDVERPSVKEKRTHERRRNDIPVAIKLKTTVVKLKLIITK